MDVPDQVWEAFKADPMYVHLKNLLPNVDETTIKIAWLYGWYHRETCTTKELRLVAGGTNGTDQAR